MKTIVTKSGQEKSSSAGESHPHTLPEPDVSLSIRPTLIVQLLVFSLKHPWILQRQNYPIEMWSHTCKYLA